MLSRLRRRPPGEEGSGLLAEPIGEALNPPFLIKATYDPSPLRRLDPVEGEQDPFGCPFVGILRDQGAVDQLQGRQGRRHGDLAETQGLVVLGKSLVLMCSCHSLASILLRGEASGK